MSLLSKIFPAQHDQLSLLLDRAGENPSARSAFYRTLLQSALFVPGEIRDGELFLRPYDVEGRRTLLVFSSPDLVRSSLRDKPEFVELPARTALSAAVSMGFASAIINLATRNQKEFTPSEIAALLDGTIFADAGDGAMLMIGVPREAPVGLMEQLRKKLPARPEVRAAYLAQVTEVDAGSNPVSAPRILIVFQADIDDGLFGSLCDNARRIAAAVGQPEVEFVRLRDDALGRYVLGETEAFYRCLEE